MNRRWPWLVAMFAFGPVQAWPTVWWTWLAALAGLALVVWATGSDEEPR